MSIRLKIRCLLAVLALGWLGAVQAQDDVRVGRLAELSGEVLLYEPERGEWEPALRNRPLTAGERLSVGRDGRAELRIGRTTLRLGAGTDLEVLVMDGDRLQVQLHRGALAVRLATREDADQTEIVTAEGRLQPLRAGLYRFDRQDESTYAGAWRGELQFNGTENVLLIRSGERFELWQDRRDGMARTQPARMPSDRLTAWALAADEAPVPSTAYGYVSPEMTGVEDLDRYGSWDEHPEYGAVWMPRQVAPGWEPFRDGRWVWMRPWGYTWVDAAPWGFAPFHYGRWLSWRSRWVWWPGPRQVRPMFAPALVAWVGGPQVGVTVTIGNRPPPPRAWLPLAPYQPYVPIYRPPPVRHVYPPAPRPPHGRPYVPPPQQVPTGPISHGRDGTPSGVTRVPSNVLAPRPAVGAVEVTPPAAGPRPAPQLAAPPAARPVPVTPAAPEVRTPTQVMPAPRRAEQPEPWRRGEPQPAAQQAAPAAAPVPVAPEKRDSRADGRRRDQTQ